MSHTAHDRGSIPSYKYFRSSFACGLSETRDGKKKKKLCLALRSRGLRTEQSLPQRLPEPTSMARLRTQSAIDGVGSPSSRATDATGDFDDATTNVLSYSRDSWRSSANTLSCSRTDSPIAVPALRSLPPQLSKPGSSTNTANFTLGNAAKRYESGIERNARSSVVANANPALMPLPRNIGSETASPTCILLGRRCDWSDSLKRMSGCLPGSRAVHVRPSRSISDGPAGP